MNDRLSGDSQYFFKDEDVMENTEKRVRLPDPGVIHMYDSGSECKCFSYRNTTRSKVTELSWAALDDPTTDSSTRLLLMSLWTIDRTRPRTFRLENVAGAPMELVMMFIRDEIGGYECALFKGDGAPMWYSCRSRDVVSSCPSGKLILLCFKVFIL